MIFRRMLAFAVVLTIGLTVMLFFINHSLEKRLDERVAPLRKSLDSLQQQHNELVAKTDPEKWQIDTVGSFTFCGVEYSLADWYFRERLQDEVLYLKDRQGWLTKIYQRFGRYRPLIEAELESQQLPRDLIYLYAWESGLDPTAISWARAAGLPQWMPGSARSFHLVVNGLYDERKDPQKSVKASCLYLKDLYQMFLDWLLAAASYNHGPTAVKNKLSQQQVNNYIDLYLPTETARYVFGIMAIKYIMEQGLMGNMSWLIPHKPLPAFVCQKIRIKSSITLMKLSQQFAVDFDEFRLLNPHLSAKLRPGTYPINLPTKKG